MLTASGLYRKCLQPGEDVPRGVGVLEDPPQKALKYSLGNVITWGIVIAINVGWITALYLQTN